MRPYAPNLAVKLFFLVSFCVFACVFIFKEAAGEDAKDPPITFPFVGEITADNVNIRAGQSTSFEGLGQLNKGTQVVVVDKAYGFYKIKLPEVSECYIHNQFVRLRFEGIGVITGNRVNVRAGPGEKFSVLGQLSKETRVKIKGEQKGWYRLEPMEGIYGWVGEAFIAFKDKQIPAPKIIVEPSRSIYKKAAAAPEPPKPKEPELFSVIGRVEDLGRVVSSKSIRHKLIVAPKTIYYLESDAGLLDSLVRYTVKVEGHLKPDPEKRFKYPVISVVKVNSLL